MQNLPCLFLCQPYLVCVFVTARGKTVLFSNDSPRMARASALGEERRRKSMESKNALGDEIRLFT